MAIEVFAELSCPFTHLSLRRIVARREDLGRSGPRLRVRPWPLELVNGEREMPVVIDSPTDFSERLANGVEEIAGEIVRNRLPAQCVAEPAKEAEYIRRPLNFASAFGERLAFFARQQAAQVLEQEQGQNMSGNQRIILQNVLPLWNS